MIPIRNDYEIYIIDALFSNDKQLIDITKLICKVKNSEERLEIIKLYKQYSDTFHMEHEPLTFTNQVKHGISTKGVKPVYSKTYRYTFIHKPEGEKQ